MPTMDLEDIKAGLKRLMPIIQTVAKLTPNRVDDLAVAFLKGLLDDEQKLSAAVALAK